MDSNFGSTLHELCPISSFRKCPKRTSRNFEFVVEPHSAIILIPTRTSFSFRSRMKKKPHLITCRIWIAGLQIRHYNLDGSFEMHAAMEPIILKFLCDHPSGDWAIHVNMISLKSQWKSNYKTFKLRRPEDHRRFVPSLPGLRRSSGQTQTRSATFIELCQ